MKALVLERIELLELVKRQAHTWRKVVEGGDQENTCTEHDVCLLRHTCMYIGTALKTFVSMAKPTFKVDVAAVFGGRNSENERHGR